MNPPSKLWIDWFIDLQYIKHSKVYGFEYCSTNLCCRNLMLKTPKFRTYSITARLVTFFWFLHSLMCWKLELKKMKRKNYKVQIRCLVLVLAHSLLLVLLLVKLGTVPEHFRKRLGMFLVRSFFTIVSSDLLNFGYQINTVIVQLLITTSLVILTNLQKVYLK